METTSFDLALTRHQSRLVMTGVTFQGKDTAAQETMGSVQYTRASLRRLKIVLIHARSKQSAAPSRFKKEFDRKVSFRPVINFGSFLFVSRPSRTLTQAKMRDAENLERYTADTPRKLFLKSKVPYRARSATDTVAHMVRDGVTTTASDDNVTKVPTGCRAVQSSGTTGGEAETKTATTGTATGVDDTLQDSRETGSVRENE